MVPPDLEGWIGGGGGVRSSFLTIKFLTVQPSFFPPPTPSLKQARANIIVVCVCVCVSSSVFLSLVSFLQRMAAPHFIWLLQMVTPKWRMHCSRLALMSDTKIVYAYACECYLSFVLFFLIPLSSRWAPVHEPFQL